MTTWTDDTFTSINVGGSYWTVQGAGANFWERLIPPPGIKEDSGNQDVSSVRQTAATTQNQYIKLYVPNRNAGWMLKLRATASPGTIYGGAVTITWNSPNLLFHNNAGTQATFFNPTMPTGPGTVEARIASNILTVIVGGATIATQDISGYGATGTYQGFGSRGFGASAGAGIIYYAEGGDTGATGTAPAQVTGLVATNVTATRIDLAWNAPANNGIPISGYKIERAPDSGGSPGTYTTLTADNGIPSPRTYSDTTVTVGQRWWYRVSAINSAGTGTASTADDATAANIVPAFSEDFANGLANWTVARWRSQGTQGTDTSVPIGNPGYVPGSSNDDGNYDGVLGTHTTPTGPGIFPPYDIFVGTGNYLYVGGGSQNYGDTFLRCAQRMDLTGVGPWTLRVGFVPEFHDAGGGLLGWTTLYLTNKPYASPSMTTDNSSGPIPEKGFAIRLDGSNYVDGSSNYWPAPRVLTYDSHTETIPSAGITIYPLTLPRHTICEAVLTFTRDWAYITANGAPWYSIPWFLPSDLTSAWVYLGAHNHATRKYTPFPDSRSATFSHINWDGPALTPQYSYPAPDSLIPSSGGNEAIGDPAGTFPGVNVGYYTPVTLSIPNVPANVSAAKLVLSSRWVIETPESDNYYIRYSLNGNTNHDIQTEAQNGSGAFAYSHAINPAELVTGTNSITINMIGQAGSFTPYVGNVSILVESFNTGKINIGTTAIPSIKAGNSNIKLLAIGATEIWRAPLPPRVPSAPTLITVLKPTLAGPGLLLRWSQPVNNGSAITDYNVQYRLSSVGNILVEPFHTITPVWTNSGMAITTSGRAPGEGIQSTGNTSANYRLSAPNESDTLTVGFAFRITDATTTIREVMRLSSDSGATNHVRMDYTPSTHTLQVTRAGAAVLGTTTAVTFVQNTWYYIEMQCKLHDTTGFVVVRVDGGSSVINATNVDTKNAGTKTVFDTLEIGARTAGTITVQYDDLYLRAGASFQGDPFGSWTWTNFSHAAQTIRTMTLTGLGDLTSYDVRVSAKNAIGDGEWSNVLAMATHGVVTIPGTPTGLTAGTPTTTTVPLSWTAPASTGGTPITDYLVEYSSNAGSSYSAFSHSASPSTSITVTGLTSATAYLFRIKAVNSVGQSATYSGTASASTTTITVPAQVTGLTVGTLTTTTVDLSWTAPANGGSAITSYTVEKSANGSTGWTSAGTPTTTSHTVTGLTTGVIQYFRVSATNGIGTGTPSANVSATPSVALTVTKSFHGGGNYVTGPVHSSPLTLPSWSVTSGDLLVVALGGCESSTATAAPNWALAGGGLTWTKRIEANSGGAYQATSVIFTAIASSTTAITNLVSTPASALGTLYAMYRVTGYNASTPIGATAQRADASTDGQQDITLSGTPAASSHILAFCYCNKDDVNSTKSIDHGAGDGWTESFDHGPSMTSTSMWGSWQGQTKTGHTLTRVRWDDIHPASETAGVYSFSATAIEIKV